MMVDTGASNIVLSREDAARAGINLADLEFSGMAQSANGMVRYANARAAELALGDVMFRNMPVTVNDGEMPGSLFGMSGLRQFASFEMRGDLLILRP